MLLNGVLPDSWFYAVWEFHHNRINKTQLLVPAFRHSALGPLGEASEEKLKADPER